MTTSTENLPGAVPAGAAAARTETATVARQRARRGTLRGLRAVLLGAVLVVLLSALSLHSNLRYGRYLTAASLPNGATFMFVLVLLANAPLTRLFPRFALSVGELAIVFSMLFVSAALPQASVAETLVTLSAAPAYFPRAAPHIGAFDGKVPPWLLVQDAEAVRQFYQGLPLAGGDVPWAAWAVPVAAWSGFVLLLLLALYCLSRAFTHRWVREERVAFPLMELPLELLRGYGSPAPLWRNRLMYLGAAVPTAMIVLGQMHTYYPSLPESQQILTIKVGEWLHNPPLSAASLFQISVWPLVIGISYLLNSEVAVSIWLFHLLFWAQLIFWTALGYDPQEGAAGARGFQPMEWIRDAEFGGALVLSAVLLLSIRGDVRRAIRALLGRERAEGLPVPPWAVVGFALANAGMLLWGRAAGANVLVVGAFLLFLYAIVVALGRMVAAGGLYLVDNGYAPQSLLYGLAGTGAIDKGSHYLLAGQEALFGRADMSFFYFATNDSKFAHDMGTENRWHAAGVVLAVLAALVSAYGFILFWSYQYGAATFRAWPLSWRVPQMYDQTAAFLNAVSRGPDPWTYAGIGAGMLIALFLVYMNRTYLWWGISPFGFVVASSWNIANQIWSSVFLGWLFASLIRRYGGLRLYAAGRPFFLGLILGDAVSVCAMALLESLLGVRGDPRAR
uniref:Uncharacterized protein n=1 Tax=uncultured Armatimonadetes bacterium TaxID=157466 RepID=A0A6J4HXB4_9BACT|nr:hypothetical protein AVDCRST_MAG63-1219 [uncultured Armatimonadetes bacterium]